MTASASLCEGHIFYFYAFTFMQESKFFSLFLFIFLFSQASCGEEISRLLHTALFLTDSVFFVLFAYFDESMASIGGYEPWKSWNIVDIIPI